MAKELYELIDTFRGMAQVEDIVDTLKVSCFLRKLRLRWFFRLLPPFAKTVPLQNTFQTHFQTRYRNNFLNAKCPWRWFKPPIM